MKFSTPDTLFPKVVCLTEAQRTFILCHPRDDMGVDPDISIVFKVSAKNTTVLRIFDREIPDMAPLSDGLAIVDDDCSLYTYFEASGWTDHGEADPRLSRISRLRIVGNDLYGLGYDGVIYVWDRSSWSQLTDPVPRLYLNDLKSTDKGKLLVAGGGGFLAEVSGRSFDRYETPTNQDLTCILPTPASTFIATGWRGTILVGDRDELTLIDAGSRNATFNQAISWQQRILLSAQDEILELSNRTLSTAWVTRNLGITALKDQLWKYSNEGVGFLSGGTWVDVPLSVEIDL